MPDILLQLPPDLCHRDEDEAALAALPSLAERIAYHAKRLPEVQFYEGAAGVQRWRTKFPEAKGIYLNTPWTTAIIPKPVGFDDYLVGMVRGWFASNARLSETNRADVQRMNEALPGANLDPDRFFSRELSPGRRAKIAAVFAEHGAAFDSKRVKTLSDVRNAVKVAKGLQSPGQPFGRVGRIVDRQLVCGSQTFRIELHSGHDCIRVPMDGSRPRLRLDALEAFVSSAGLIGWERAGNEPHSLLSVAIREPAPNAETPSFDLLNGLSGKQSPRELAPDRQPSVLPPEELAPNADMSLGELAPFDPLALTDEEISAVRASVSAHSTTCISDPDADPDPLAL